MTTHYRVTTPVEGKNGKTYFRQIGVAFPQREGSKSFMKIQLEAFPINGELVLFEPKDKEDDEGVTE
ncbi:hypothetical protein EU803_15625 [Loktanella sp. IMCC34160]|uniref:hypothetical protein n=1 Tax=Loktanella sp. IMCC34160 TaxID=2510646 RepID=UPI00101D5D5D|nr:hypothetical protein [Loktanella sp. IMCC34160]RYG90028.1 hypothetical protein EU803_15550 [Loktanella sp. IMCC34160]RYG90043.1 hypothetical protein EU803_15625 [Loktanella sp. IMCC34160]